MRALILLLLTTFATQAFAQSVAQGNTNTWFLLMTRFNLSEKVGITNEIHERTGDFLNDQATFILRPSVDYVLNNNIELSAGYSFVRSAPHMPYSQPISRNEHNVWEQVLLKFKTAGVSVQNRIRMEHRFIDDIVVRNEATNPTYDIGGSSFRNRFRFRFIVSFDLFKLNHGKQSIFINCFDEAFINQSDNLMPNNFDRNWFYTGIGYKFNKDFNIQLAHMHQYDKVGNNTFISSSIIQLSVLKFFNMY